jgi:hypothetical protein
MALEGSTTVISLTNRGLSPWGGTMSVARRELLALVLLVFIGLACTLFYYSNAYRTTVQADDRIRGLFVGFQSLEGTTEPYRWSKGAGQVCLPANGPTRRLAGLELRLLGSTFTQGVAERAIDQATLRVGAHALPFTIAPENRVYQLLIPPGPEAGPVCVTLESATVTPAGTNRVAGVGVRSLTLWNMLPGGAPPLNQLMINLWLAVGSYGLLRMAGFPLRLVLPGCAGLALILGGGVISGNVRVAPDLPYWSTFAAGAVGALFATTLIYRWSAPRLRLWQQELLGVGLILGLLSFGWAVLANLPGYFWPFPLMARAGTSMNWTVLLPASLCAAYIGLTLYWLRATKLPPAPLVIGSAWLAAIVLPVTLKVSLWGWESLFQNFALQEGSYIRDVPKVGTDPLGFLRDYVAQMPDLVLHNKTHPPGTTLFLWGVERLFGPGPEPATWAVIALVGLGAWPTYRFAEAVADRRAAILAAAIYVLLPAFMIYAAVAMDALYAVVLAWATWSLYAAFVVQEKITDDQLLTTDQRQIGAVLAAGAWIGLGLLFSFTTLMLVFVVGALVFRRLILGPRRTQDMVRWLTLGGILGGTTLLLLLLLWLLTGYDSIAAFFSGVANNRLDVSERVSPLGLSSYLFFLAVNSVAWGWFLGPWVVYRLWQGGHQGWMRTLKGDKSLALIPGIGVATLVLGLLFSGLFYREIERIWLFSHVLVAPALAIGITERPQQRERLLLAGMLLITLCLHSIIFRATLRVSW